MGFIIFVGLIIAILLIRKNNNEKKEEAAYRAQQERYAREERALAEEMTKSPMTQKILREIHSRPIADISFIDIGTFDITVDYIKGSSADNFRIFYHDEGFSNLSKEKVTALGRVIYCSLNCSTKFKAEYRIGSYHITREYSSW